MALSGSNNTQRKSHKCCVPFTDLQRIPTIFTRARFKQLKRYLHFCDPNVPVPAVNDPAFDRLHKIRPVVSMLQEKFETL